MKKRKLAARVLALLLCAAALLTLLPAAMGADDSRISTVTVNFRYADGSTAAESYGVSLEKGSTFQTEVAIPAIPGYTASVGSLPDGVKLDTDKLTFDLNPVAGSMIVNVTYNASQTTYYVKLALQGLDGEYEFLQNGSAVAQLSIPDGYVDINEFLADKASALLSEQGEYPEHYFNGVSKAGIDADGNKFVTLYYDLRAFVIAFDPNGGVGGPAAITARYGSVYTADAYAVTPTREGYEFRGWLNTEGMAPDGTVLKNEVYYAQWEQKATKAGLTVIHWGQNANNDEYAWLGSEVMDIPVGSEVTWEAGHGILICEEEHTHTDACYADLMERDPALWNCVRSDTVTVAAEGNTVLNVYFDRNVVTRTFRYGADGKHSEDITARWGKNVSEQFDAIKEKAVAAASEEDGILKKAFFGDWVEDGSKQHTTAVIAMPKTNGAYEAVYLESTPLSPVIDELPYSMRYYLEDLNGTYPDTKAPNIEIQIFTKDLVITTDSDYFEIPGFTPAKNETKEHPILRYTEFHYKRNTYTIKYYSKNATESIADKDASVKYGENLGNYRIAELAEANKPETMDVGSTFTGEWYLNPAFTGEPFDFESKTMDEVPSGVLALYAKWELKKFTVRVFSAAGTTDETKLYTCEGFTGKQTVLNNKFASAPGVEPKLEGESFLGWFCMVDGKEEKFSFDTPITRDYDVYPKFSSTEKVDYTVHYICVDTNEKIASDTNAQAPLGSTVELDAKFGDALDLLPEGEQSWDYYPGEPHQFVVIDRNGQEITFYYERIHETTYTVRYVDEKGTDLTPRISPAPEGVYDPETGIYSHSTTYSKVTELAPDIYGYTPVENYVLFKDVESGDTEFVFTYKRELVDFTLTGNPGTIVTVKGAAVDAYTKDVSFTLALNEYGTATVKNIHTGSYIVSEDTNWNWRDGAVSLNTTLVPYPTESENIASLNGGLKNDLWISAEMRTAGDLDR